MAMSNLIETQGAGNIMENVQVNRTLLMMTEPEGTDLSAKEHFITHLEGMTNVSGDVASRPYNVHFGNQVALLGGAVFFSFVITGVAANSPIEQSTIDNLSQQIDSSPTIPFLSSSSSAVNPGSEVSVNSSGYISTETRGGSTLSSVENVRGAVVSEEALSGLGGSTFDPNAPAILIDSESAIDSSVLASQTSELLSGDSESETSGTGGGE